MKHKINISLLISTLFGLGHFSRFPGTIASFVTLPIFWSLSIHISHTNLIILFVILTILSFLIIHLALKVINEKDPGFIVLDEFIGQFIALLFCNGTFSAYIVAFIIFRIFDILKPFPISFFDKLNNSFGVLMDDIIAGLFSGIIVYFLYDLN